MMAAAAPAPVPACLDLSLRDSMASLAAAQQRLQLWLQGSPVSAADRHRVELVFEELASNVIRHGYAGSGAGEHRIAAQLRLWPGEAELSLEDHGRPFDPRGGAGRPLSGTLDEVKIGGLGLLLVQQLCSRMDYRRTADGRNQLMVALSLEASPGSA